MPTSEGIEIKDGCVVYRPAGPMTPRLFVDMLKRGLDACRENRLTRLLVDTTGLSGPPFTTTQRFEVASETAAGWDKSVKLAIVNPPDRPPPDEFAKTVALNRGLNLALFTSEPAALEWLTQ